MALVPAPAFTRTVEPANLRIRRHRAPVPGGPGGHGRRVGARHRDRRRPDQPGAASTAPLEVRRRRPAAGPTARPSAPTAPSTSPTTAAASTGTTCMGMTFPGSPPPASWPGHGSLQRVDLATGEVTDARHRVRRQPAAGTQRPRRRRRRRHLVHRPRRARGPHLRPHRLLPLRRRRVGPGRGRPCSTRPTASACRPTAAGSTWPRPTPGRLWGWNVDGPGQVSGSGMLAPKGAELVGDPGGGAMFDSLAVDGDGWICVATSGMTPGITAFAPDGSECEYTPLRRPAEHQHLLRAPTAPRPTPPCRAPGSWSPSTGPAPAASSTSTHDR